MRKLNNIVIILLNDGRKMCLDVSNARTAQKSAIDFLIQEGIPNTMVKTIIFRPDTKYSAYEYQYYYNETTKKINLKAILIDKKIEDIKKKRGLMLTKLDLEFMKSLEEDCGGCKDHIVKMKNYLRDLPAMLEIYLPHLSPEEVSDFNAFNNIFRIFLIDGGGGYTSTPTITIDPPKGAGSAGFPLHAIATIKDKKVNSVIVTQTGSGYINIPKIRVSEPDEEGGKIAFAIASDPENDIFQSESRWDGITVLERETKDKEQ
jgi:hypothetical protein